MKYQARIVMIQALCESWMSERECDEYIDSVLELSGVSIEEVAKELEQFYCLEKKIEYVRNKFIKETV